ncbi:MAG: tryptophan-rich sensory protein [Ruminococcaceae bacterium]|nr:tryptophan-rich sensory protein [Oscillospiraceae bacterium]
MIKTFNLKTLKSLIIALLVTLIPAGLSALITMNSMGRYNELTKPFFAPPSNVFGIVWAILYPLIGIGLFLITKDGLDMPGVWKAVKKYLYLIALLFIWPILYFNFELDVISLIVIIAAFILSIMVGKEFYEQNKIAGIILWLLSAWLGFATVLSISILILN